MRRPDATALHSEARRYRSRLIACLIRRAIRAVARTACKPRAQPPRPALAR